MFFHFQENFIFKIVEINCLPLPPQDGPISWHERSKICSGPTPTPTFASTPPQPVINEQSLRPLLAYSFHNVCVAANKTHQARPGLWVYK